MPHLWTPTDEQPGAWEMREDTGHRWLLVPMSDNPERVTLYRLAEGQTLPSAATSKYSSVDEEWSVGYFRSPAEAKIAAAIMLTPSPSIEEVAAQLAANGFQEGEGYDERRWWRKQGHGYSLSIYLGGDEDLRDVVVYHQRPGEGIIRLPCTIGHGEFSNHTDPSAAAGLRVAATLLDLLERTNRMNAPLGEAEWETWNAGRPIEPRPVTLDRQNLINFIVASAKLCREDDDTMLAVETVVAALQEDEERPETAPDLLAPSVEAAMARVTKLCGAAPDKYAKHAAGINAETRLQYAFTAAVFGLDAARRLVASTGPSGPRI